MKVARRFIAGLSEQRASSRLTIEMDAIRVAVQASRWDARALWDEPGNKLPGYSRKSRWDFNSSRPNSMEGREIPFIPLIPSKFSGGGSAAPLRGREKSGK